MFLQVSPMQCTLRVCTTIASQAAACLQFCSKPLTRRHSLHTRKSPLNSLLALFIATLTLHLSVALANANDLPKPTGKVLLTVSGNISITNQADQAAFDLKMLEAMKATTFETHTPWTEGLTKFTGVTLKHLLEAVGSESHIVKMHAEDGYIYELDRAIEDKHPVMVAYKKNDKYMSLRQLGPLWVIFPFDDFPELNTEENRAASVWQLNRMELK